MANLIYIESVRHKKGGLGVVHCEVVLPGLGQATVDKTLYDATTQKLTREKLILLDDLLQKGVPNRKGTRYKLCRADVTVYTGDLDMLEDLRSCMQSGGTGKNKDICERIFAAAAAGGYILHFEEKSLLQKMVRDAACRYLYQKEVFKRERI